MKRNNDELLPAIRPIEVVPFRAADGEIYFALRDPLQLANRSVAVSAAAGLVLTYLDGRHTQAQAQQEFQAQTGMALPPAEIEKLLAALDHGLLLDNERCARALAEREAAYVRAETRVNRDGYPPAAELRVLLESIVAEQPPTSAVGLRGLIAPHLDYPRGRPAYAAAYATLAAHGVAERYVILGTNHAGTTLSAVATGKDFETPLGRVANDRVFLERLEQRLGMSLRGGEADHQREHSIELQVHFLQVIAKNRPFTIVPILCPDVCGPTRSRPLAGTGPDLLHLGAAIHDLIAADGLRTVVIAGADLSHVGQAFDDPAPTTRESLRAVAASDTEFIEGIQESRWVDAFEALARRGNPTRICSTGALLTLRAALPDGDLRLLRYHQASDFDADTHVTCVAAAIC